MAGIVINTETYMKSGEELENARIVVGGSLWMTWNTTVRNTDVSGGALNVEGSPNASGEKAYSFASVIQSGQENVYLNGVATGSIVQNGAKQYINEGLAVETSIQSGGEQQIRKGTARETEILSGGIQNVEKEGTAQDTIVEGIQNVRGLAEGKTYINAGGMQNLMNGGVSNGAFVLSGGIQSVQNKGIAQNGSIRGTQNVKDGGTVKNTVIETGGLQTLEAGAIVDGVITVKGNVAASGTVSTASGGAVFLLDLTVRSAGSEAVLSGFDYLKAASFSVTVRSQEVDGSRFLLADGANERFTGSIAVNLFDGVSTILLGAVSLDKSLRTSGRREYTLTQTEGDLSLTVDIASLFSGDPQCRPVNYERYRFDWTPAGDVIVGNTVIRFSRTSDFSSEVIEIKVDGGTAYQEFSAFDSGTWYYQVGILEKGETVRGWSKTGNFEIKNEFTGIAGVAEKFVGCGEDNLFHYVADGVWSGSYKAGGMNSTLSGYNRNFDVFTGTEKTYDRIVMTGDNDALFLDDLCSPFASGLVAQSRIVFVNDIRCGAGNDIVDLRSDRWNSGDIRLFGEAGNDILFGGNGKNLLWGGEGDDSLYCGSGTNTVVFEDGWGNDVLSAGDQKLSLVFEKSLEGKLAFSEDRKTVSAEGNTLTLDRAVSDSEIHYVEFAGLDLKSASDKIEAVLAG